MNVYVRALASALARRCRVRRVHPVGGCVAASSGRGRAGVPRRARHGRAAHAAAALRAPGPRRRVRQRDDATPRCRSAGRGVARQLLAVGRGRAPAQAPARSPDGRDVPHAGARQGRRRYRRRSRRARAVGARGDRLLRPDARVHRRRARSTRDALRRGARAGRGRAARRRPLRVLPPTMPRRQASARARRPAHAAVRRTDPAAQGRRHGRALPRRAR